MGLRREGGRGRRCRVWVYLLPRGVLRGLLRCRGLPFCRDLNCSLVMVVEVQKSCDGKVAIKIADKLFGELL